MSFETDKQTLDDLNILGKYKNNSVYSLFSGTVTRGGECLLENMFLHPLADAREINRRVTLLRYFKKHDFSFPGGKALYDQVEQYLRTTNDRSWVFNLFQLCRAKCMEIVSHDRHYRAWQYQVEMTIDFLGKTRHFLHEVARDMEGLPLEDRVKQSLELLDSPDTVKMLEPLAALSLKEMFTRDLYFRCTRGKSFITLLELLHELDACIIVGRVARECDFCFPEVSTNDRVSMRLTGLHHPLITGAVSNDLEITRDRNIFFLTGANMAGKSTLMKSFGIAVYMAHMGFPVAAKSMEFSVQDGMYTSINVPDNISLGYSHFYAEVLRVKKVAEEVSKSKRLVVIFDELFKGTNVKDAYDATLAVTKALSKRRLCSFMISTHIIEVGQELSKACDNVTFAYLPTIMNGHIPVYTYKLESGITSDKHGMLIINNERIVEIIRGQ